MDPWRAGEALALGARRRLVGDGRVPRPHAWCPEKVVTFELLIFSISNNYFLRCNFALYRDIMSLSVQAVEFRPNEIMVRMPLTDSLSSTCFQACVVFRQLMNQSNTKNRSTW